MNLEIDTRKTLQQNYNNYMDVIKRQWIDMLH